MNLVDIAIILILAICGFVGFKRGLTHELVSCFGIFVVIVLAFILKNPLSMFLYEHLPFFRFGGLFKGLTALNILIYEVIAFLIVLSILAIILKVISVATNIFEKLLRLTIVLGFPSKLLGLVVGLIEGYLWSFIFLFVFSLPTFDIKMIYESTFRDTILNKTPILSSVAGGTTNVINEFTLLTKNYKEEENVNEYNLMTMDIFLKYKVITVKSTKKLVDMGKLNLNGINELIDKYSKDDSNDK